MTAKVETAIWLALKARIDLLPLDYAKAWPSQTFTVPHDGVLPLPYLRIGRVSSAPARLMLANNRQHSRKGFLIITLVYPLGQDVSVYDQIVGTITDHFKDGTQMKHGDVCVTVKVYPHAQEGYEDNGYWAVPIRITWQCFA